MADVNAAHVPSRRGLPQALRLTAAAVYVGYLLGLGLYLNDSLPPPFGLTGLWFYAAFAAIVLGDFIIEPFFTKPADALANAVAVLVAASVSLNGAVVSASRRESLAAGRTETARQLARKAVVLLEPAPLQGRVVWPPSTGPS